MRTEHIHPIRNVRYLRPQKECKEIIAIYLYLAGMGAGLYIIGTIINWSVVISECPAEKNFPSIFYFDI